MDQTLTLAGRIRLLVEWAPALQILPAIAASDPGRDRAVEIVRLLEFLAQKTEVKLDDDIVRMVKAILLTREGGELADYIAKLISEAIYNDSNRPSGT